MTKKSVMIDLDDPRTEKIANVMSNKNTKRILSLMVEADKCVSDIAKELKMPLNTAEYNIKQLMDAGLIERSKKFLWSVKGKKVAYYRISDKRIIISPRNIVKGVLPAVVISGVVALGIRFFSGSEGIAKTESASADLMAAGAEAATRSAYAASAADAWIWFFAGAVAGLMIFLLWNYFIARKR